MTTLRDKVINTCEVLWSLSILVFLLIFCVFAPLTHCVNDIVVCITAITIIVWVVTTVILVLFDEDFQGGGGHYY